MSAPRVGPGGRRPRACRDGLVRVHGTGSLLRGGRGRRPSPHLGSGGPDREAECAGGGRREGEATGGARARCAGARRAGRPEVRATGDAGFDSAASIRTMKRRNSYKPPLF